MRNQFKLFPSERLFCSECGRLMKAGDTMSIEEGTAAVLLRCDDCTKRLEKEMRTQG